MRDTATSGMAVRVSARSLAPLALMAGATVGLLILSRPGLGGPSIWLDEAVSVYSARTDWWPPLDALRTDSVRYSSFYYLVLGAWSTLGDSEAVLRSLSVLFAAASVPATFVLARRYFGGFVGGVAAAFLAANSLFAEFAREARGYTLLVFLMVTSMLLFAYAIERRSRWSWAGWALVTALGMYVHWFAVYIIAAQLLSLLFLPDAKSSARALAGGLLLLAAAVAPLAYVVASSGAPGTDWMRVPALADVTPMYVVIAGGTGLLAAGYLAAGAVGVWRSRPVVYPLGRWPVALVAAWAVVPLVASFVASQVVPMFLDRYLIISTPAVAVLAAIGFGSVRPRAAGVALAGALLLGSAVSAISTVQSIQHEDWRSATRYVLTETRPGDGIIFYSGSTRQPFEYYVERLAATPPRPIYPPGPWGVDKPLAGRESGSPAEALASARWPSRVWLVLSHAPDTAEREALLAEFEAHYTLVSEEVFDLWVFARLYERVQADTGTRGGRRGVHLSPQHESIVGKWSAAGSWHGVSDCVP